MLAKGLFYSRCRPSSIWKPRPKLTQTPYCEWKRTLHDIEIKITIVSEISKTINVTIIPKTEEEKLKSKKILENRLGFNWTNWYGTVYMLISVKMWINIAVYLLEIKRFFISKSEFQRFTFSRKNKAVLTKYRYWAFRILWVLRARTGRTRTVEKSICGQRTSSLCKGKANEHSMFECFDVRFSMVSKIF